MRRYLRLTFCLYGGLVLGQTEFGGIIMDADEKVPLEFVHVFNRKHSTISNTDGRFLLKTSLDTVLFFRNGYEKKALSLKALKDTIYLEKKVVALDEVVVTNAKTILQKIKDSINSNYLLTPHTETFFIRALLRKNDTLVRLQDMTGTLLRKTSIYGNGLEMEKKDYQVELAEMRQLGIIRDVYGVYFELPSLYNIFGEFMRLNAMGPEFDVIEKPYENSEEIRVEFNSLPSEDRIITKGHYIINGKDNAILSFEVNNQKAISNTKPSLDKYSHFLKGSSSMYFKEDVEKGLYYLHRAKRTFSLEVKTEKHPAPDVYEIEITLYTPDSFGNEKVKSNVNEHKDIFMLKHPYNEAYWQEQSWLPVTEEIKEFIQTIGKGTSGLKTKGNMN
ncbi:MULTISPECIES: hypothetical protein [Maribacter]|uniref:Carboxypeptidase-like regulatory domain-containing protein n=1 Tax=Maribacter flavus TaxID=1658664 RepID=A0ABU7ILZ8_9FLAO|nr:MULTISPECIES: hypothetical protein [Maribacter]MDC6406802.1 hypothetical protein [Maribacter sp. PR66]MEE1973920.1 hypothetical protein [Maribacter flavus]